MLHLLFAFFAVGHDTLPPGTTIIDPDRDTSIVFTRTEEPAYFIGGPEALKKLVDSTLSGKKHVSGTCVIQFILRRDSTLYEVVALTNADSRLARALVQMVWDHPKSWHPAVQNGRMVKAYHKETITYP